MHRVKSSVRGQHVCSDAELGRDIPVTDSMDTDRNWVVWGELQSISAYIGREETTLRICTCHMRYRAGRNATIRNQRWTTDRRWWKTMPFTREPGHRDSLPFRRRGNYALARSAPSGSGRDLPACSSFLTNSGFFIIFRKFGKSLTSSQSQSSTSSSQYFSFNFRGWEQPDRTQLQTGTRDLPWSFPWRSFPVT